MATEVEDNGNVDSRIISIVENRSREICICQMNTSQVKRLKSTELILQLSTLYITIIADTHYYAESTAHIADIMPNEILLQDGSKDHVLTTRIFQSQQKIPNCKVNFINRQYFDQDRGVDTLNKVTVGKVDSELTSKYTVLAAANCLIRYMEFLLGIVIANNSIRIEYTSSCVSRLLIDRRTANALELVSNSCDGNQKSSLFGIVNHTCTTIGARLLRSTILNPSTDIETIVTRQQSSEHLIRCPTHHQTLCRLLKELPDIDKTLNGITSKAKTPNSKVAKASIETLIMLKHVLLKAIQIGKCIRDIAQGDEHEMKLYRQIEKNITHDHLISIVHAIDEVLTDSTQYSKSPQIMRHQECFAIKPGRDGILDIARQTYEQSVEDINKLAQQYENAITEHMKVALPVKVAYNPSRSYFLNLPSYLNPIPDGFIQAVLNKKSISCTTREVLSLSDRSKEAISQALLITNTIVQQLFEDKIRPQMSILFILADSIATLDMLQSFAEYRRMNLPNLAANKSSKSSSCFPTITASGPLYIKGGIHPIVSAVQIFNQESRDKTPSNMEFKKNNTVLDDHTNTYIITGCNGSGKTVYIKQIALIIILAQMGCCIPAEEATIPIRDRILSRIGSNDDLEHNLSSFMLEMKECAYICDNLTERSLVVLDEVGRGTSNLDGMSLAFGIGEYLHRVHPSAFTLFVTHFSQTTMMPQLYKGCRNMHMNASIVTNAVGQGKIKYEYELVEGPCLIADGYGITAAEQCGIPTEILTDAKFISKIVLNKFPTLLKKAPLDHRKAFLKTVLTNLNLLRNSSLPQEQLIELLRKLRESCILQLRNATQTSCDKETLQDLQNMLVTHTPNVLETPPNKYAETIYRNVACETHCEISISDRAPSAMTSFMTSKKRPISSVVDDKQIFKVAEHTEEYVDCIETLEFTPEL